MFDGMDMSVVPFFVGAEAWPSFAGRVRPHLEKMAAGSGGRYMADDLEVLIGLGAMQIWLALDGADIACVMVTEVINFPRLREMRCIGVVGHRPKRWMHLLATVEAAARENFGCGKFSALHQPEHVRLLATDGWQTTHCLSEKWL